eukprot:s90_g13.t1
MGASGSQPAESTSLPSAARSPHAPSNMPEPRRARRRRTYSLAGAPQDFLLGGVPLGPDTLAVGPSQPSGDSMKHATFAGSGLMRYSLEVEICSSRGLRNADWMTLGVGGTSDPYCICQVIGAGKTEFRTKTIDNTVEPEFSNVDDFFEGDVLLFRVYDEDTGKEDDFLGQVELPTCSVLPNGFRGELRLRKTSADGSDSQEAYLTVGVAILDSRHDPTPPPRADTPQLFRVEIQYVVVLSP